MMSAGSQRERWAARRTPRQYRVEAMRARPVPRRLLQEDRRESRAAGLDDRGLGADDPFLVARGTGLVEAVVGMRVGQHDTPHQGEVGKKEPRNEEAQPLCWRIHDRYNTAGLVAESRRRIG